MNATDMNANDAPAGRMDDTARTWTREDVWIPSGPRGERCAAWVYRPAIPPVFAGPCLVMAHGFGGVRELRLDAFAERFAAAGYTAVVFDYRHFGASDGEPRQILDVDRQHEDWAAAVSFARAVPTVDASRIVLWGTSFGGGHVLAVAARDPRIAAVVAQVPHTDALAATRSTPVTLLLRLMLAALRDRLGALVGRAPHYVPIFGAPGDVAAMTVPGALDAVERLRPAGFAERNEVAARVFFRMATYSPGRMSKYVRCPLLVLACEKDRITPAAAAEAAAKSAPQGVFVKYPIDHFDIYAGPFFERAVADTLDFLRQRGLESAPEAPRAASPIHAAVSGATGIGA